MPSFSSGKPSIEIRHPYPQSKLLPLWCVSCRWNVRHDAPITRGAIRELPVSVMAVTRGSCEGVDVPGFWQAMGMERAHEGLRAGSIFSLVAADQKIEVLFPCVTSFSTFQAIHLLCLLGLGGIACRDNSPLAGRSGATAEACRPRRYSFSYRREPWSSSGRSHLLRSWRLTSCRSGGDRYNHAS